jgi:hypothetical protein
MAIMKTVFIIQLPLPLGGALLLPLRLTLALSVGALKMGIAVYLRMAI